MKLIDVNGNTVRELKKLPRNITGTYHTDWHGRVMVDVKGGGHVVFFERDRPKLTASVKMLLKQRR